MKALTRADKAKLRQISKELSYMSYFFAAYACLDLGWTTFSFLRRFRAEKFLIEKHVPKTVVFMSMRLILAFEGTNYLKNQHMLVNARPILRRKTANPRRQALLEKMNQF